MSSARNSPTALGSDPDWLTDEDRRAVADLIHNGTCWRYHPFCAVQAVEFLAEGAEVLMSDVLDVDDADPNALEMRHRLHVLGFTQTDPADGTPT